MKINDSYLPSSDLRSQLVERTEQAPLEGRIREKLDRSSDSASLSALSVEISRALEQDPPEVVARIARLQEAVENGTYSIPNRELAERIVTAAFESEL